MNCLLILSLTSSLYYRLQIVRRDFENVVPHRNLTTPVYIDGTVGRLTTFRIQWDQNPVTVELRNPSGHVYTLRSTSVAVVDTSRQKADFRLPGLIQVQLEEISSLFR